MEKKKNQQVNKGMLHPEEESNYQLLDNFQTKRQWNDIFVVLKENSQPRILYTECITFKVTIKTFLSKQKLIEFIIRNHELQEMLRVFSRRKMIDGNLNLHNKTKL